MNVSWPAATESPGLTPGTLYLVATPIGNLLDITLRALFVLQHCDLVAAEDTRRTGQLLRHFGIQKALISLHQFNEARRTEPIEQRLKSGETVALVSDAGTPGISDPGSRLVSILVKNGIRVEPVPGPCALIAALTASGLPTDEFHFCGFLPVKSGQRNRRLTALLNEAGTLVLYESPYRMEKLLRELAELAPQRPLVVARELTKKFEEWQRGTAATLLEAWTTRPRKGEFVVLIAPAQQELGARAQHAIPTEDSTAMRNIT